MFLGVVETKILDLCPLPPIYPFQTTYFRSRTGPIRPRIKKRGFERGSKTPRNPEMVKKPQFLLFLGFWPKLTFLGGYGKTHGLDTPEPYLNPLKHSFGSVWLL